MINGVRYLKKVNSGYAYTLHIDLSSCKRKMQLPPLKYIVLPHPSITVSLKMPAFLQIKQQMMPFG